MFQFEVKAVTVVDAPTEQVWETLTAVDEYAAWSTMLHYEGGTLAVGERLKLRLTLPGGQTIVFRPPLSIFGQTSATRGSVRPGFVACSMANTASSWSRSMKIERASQTARFTVVCSPPFSGVCR